MSLHFYFHHLEHRIKQLMANFSDLTAAHAALAAEVATIGHSLTALLPSNTALRSDNATLKAELASQQEALDAAVKETADLTAQLTSISFVDPGANTTTS